MKSSIVFTFILILFVVTSCQEAGGPQISGEKQRGFANALYQRELYAQALKEYQQYLNYYSVDDDVRANIHFVMANIYFERLHDYENAMAHYLRIKHVFPESLLQDKVSKQVVACLERLQRSADAKQALDEATSLDPSGVPESRPGTVIAKIGDREITSGDLDFQIDQLPDYLKSQFDSKEKKLEFLNQYLGTELFYGAAKRKSLDSDKDVIEGTFQAKKGLMVQKYLQDEITSQVQITPEDVELYFKANQDKYAEKDEKDNVVKQKSFPEIQEQVVQDYAKEKQQKVYEDILRRMMVAEKVEIYDDLVQ